MRSVKTHQTWSSPRWTPFSRLYAIHISHVRMCVICSLLCLFLLLLLLRFTVCVICTVDSRATLSVCMAHSRRVHSRRVHSRRVNCWPRPGFLKTAIVNCHNKALRFLSFGRRANDHTASIERPPAQRSQRLAQRIESAVDESAASVGRGKTHPRLACPAPWLRRDCPKCILVS